MKQPLLLFHLLSLFPALELIAVGPPPDKDADPVIQRVYNKFAAVKNISKRHVCPEGKHQSGDNCCDRCEPGYVKENDCTASSKTICKKCVEGEEYTEGYNYLSKCQRCSSCDAAHGLEVDKPCISSRNVKCRCKRGFFCNSSEPCAHCDPCSKCEGIIVEECTLTKDTVCGSKTNLGWIAGIIVPLVLPLILFIIWKYSAHPETQSGVAMQMPNLCVLQTSAYLDTRPLLPCRRYKKVRMPRTRSQDEQETAELKPSVYPDTDLTTHISDIAEEMTLAQVMKFVRKQGMSNPTIERIRLDNMHDASEVKIKLLETWFQENGIKGAYGTLISSLKDLKLHTLAQKIERKIDLHIQNNANVPVYQNMDSLEESCHT